MSTVNAFAMSENAHPVRLALAWQTDDDHILKIGVDDREPSGAPPGSRSSVLGYLTIIWCGVPGRTVWRSFDGYRAEAAIQLTPVDRVMSCAPPFSSLADARLAPMAAGRAWTRGIGKLDSGLSVGANHLLDFV